MEPDVVIMVYNDAQFWEVYTEDAFCLNKTEMSLLLDPELYIGRCPEQVDAFLKTIRPMLEETIS